MVDNELIDIDMTMNNILIDDEYDLDEIKSKIVGRTILKGLYAGAGKTTASVHYNKKALFVCPTNKLCQGLKEKGVEAITFSKLFGLFADDKDLKNIKKYDIEGFKCVCAGTDDDLKIYFTELYEKDRIVSYIAKRTRINRAGFSLKHIEKIPRNESGKVQYSALG